MQSDLQLHSPPPSTQLCGWYEIYYLYWELCQCGLITRDGFDRGVTTIHCVLETQHLLNLHQRINNGPPTALLEPWNMMDYFRLLLVIGVVYEGAGDTELEAMLGMTEAVIGMMRAGRARMGM